MNTKTTNSPRPETRPEGDKKMTIAPPITQAQLALIYTAARSAALGAMSAKHHRLSEGSDLPGTVGCVMIADSRSDETDQVLEWRLGTITDSVSLVSASVTWTLRGADLEFSTAPDYSFLRGRVYFQANDELDHGTTKVVFERQGAEGALVQIA